MKRIPFNRPFIIGKELHYISQSVLSGHTAGNGMFTKKCHELLKEKLGTETVLLTTSCTAALEMAAILCEIGPGDEVILPSFTFVSTANAFYLRGARPVFVDIRPDTLNLDETKIEEAITKRTRVIVPVHYGGVGCDMDTIMDIGSRRNVYVVEDAAQAMNARYRDNYLGTIGDLGAYSFHETKNCICGEGGAIMINNESFIERAEVIWEKGTDRSKFFRGEVNKYTWVDLGSSYLPSDLLAAFLYAQLENMDTIDVRRRNVFNYYLETLRPLEDKGLLKLPVIPPECSPCGHLFFIILNDEESRDELMKYLKSKGIGAVFHYLPLHLSPVGLSLGYAEGQLPVTEKISCRLLRLPLFYELEREEQDQVVGSIRSFFA
ncbi:MAG: dTDP-4-amino-4,6-dideoxygalactose transaminase [Thermodesulfobacteriota bacterium]|nr:dTDP-4-amino-4,6-dideoxygalactose transaminase [Thermodesulfobacteriota bacterium]